MNQLTEGPIGFALIQVDGRTPREISERMSVVCDCVAHTNAVIDCLFSGFIIISVGTMAFHTKNPELEIEKVVEEIRKNDSGGLRLVLGGVLRCIRKYRRHDEIFVWLYYSRFHGCIFESSEATCRKRSQNMKTTEPIGHYRQ